MDLLRERSRIWCVETNVFDRLREACVAFKHFILGGFSFHALD